MLVKAGSGVMTAGVPDSAGVPAACAGDTLTAAYNDLESVELLFAENPGKIAAVIVEPVAANMGVVEPAGGFLKGLRRLCDENGAALIFDEVITGFRLAFGGAQERYGVEADLVTYGKIIGAGMPVGAYGGRREIMERVAPVGSVYQAGTLSGNPVAMAAGLAQLRYLREHPEVYAHIESLGRRLRGGLREAAPGCAVTGAGSLCCLFLPPARSSITRRRRRPTPRGSRAASGFCSTGGSTPRPASSRRSSSRTRTPRGTWTPLRPASRISSARKKTERDRKGPPRETAAALSHCQTLAT